MGRVMNAPKTEDRGARGERETEASIIWAVDDLHFTSHHLSNYWIVLDNCLIMTASHNTSHNRGIV